MRTFSLFLLGLICAGVLVYGNMYWQEKTSVSSAEKTANVTEETDQSTEVEPDFDSLIVNWPEDAQASFKKAVADGTPYKLAIVGSLALGADENGWSEQVKSELIDTYGDNIEVKIFQYDTTSLTFVNGENVDEVLNYEPQLVLLEPFALNDNSNGVGGENNQESIQIFKRKLSEQNEDAVLILQPTHPIAGATYYPLQIEKLKDFAEENEIPYLNHWSAWPVDDEEALGELLAEDQETPSEEGHALWAEYLVDYFIAK
ncbi:SGNH/GDSL hydrolase family protein [Rossellomorea vietnamensis]|uniref:SGNH/GDSL hydrolase family protein n=1 Tax=Rossellomorea vietnamensis TaxID=218284 RepID=UPI001CCEA5C1|nr:SGNH/GDSL hydrolase family protein [Rossellomorea vietnamensis]MCA0150363.1 SGNH/GDSL hydrolase family protein [Rossellomorea vietnamensis]